MRIASADGSDFFTIRTIGRNGGGDVRAKVRAKGGGFAGSNPHVWFDTTSINAFVSALRALEETRKGEARIASMSPDECTLRLWAADRLGHVHLEVYISRCDFHYGETDFRHCRLRFPVDPTAMPALTAELIEELTQGSGSSSD